MKTFTILFSIVLLGCLAGNSAWAGSRYVSNESITLVNETSNTTIKCTYDTGTELTDTTKILPTVTKTISVFGEYGCYNPLDAQTYHSWLWPIAFSDQNKGNLVLNNLVVYILATVDFSKLANAFKSI